MTSGSSHRRGQALVELAIFGSLLIMVLGALISYGLNYDFSQQVSMEAFRRALATASNSPANNQPISASHIVLKDRHIPSPSDPFGVGSVTPVSSSASVTRNYKLQEVPENEAELPRIAVQVKGGTCPPGTRIAPVPASADSADVATCYFLAAGFLPVSNASEGSLGRYQLIFGEQNVCSSSDCGGGRVCVRYESEIDPETGIEEQVCVESVYSLRIIDSCNGEIISYEGCVKQSLKIVDSDECRRLCDQETYGSGGVDCTGVCEQEIPEEAYPWYVQGATKAGGRWVFPRLQSLFAGAERMGLQPSYVKVTQTNNQLAKRESDGTITTQTTHDWQQTTTRTLRRRAAGDESGAPVLQDVPATTGEQSTTTWTTPQ